MKRIRLLLLLLIALGLCVLSSCGGTEGPNPPQGVAVEYETLTVRWDEVSEANKYTLRIERQGGDVTVAESSRNYYSLEALAPGEYSISVRADGREGESEYSNPVSFTRDEETGLSFKLVDGGYQVSGKGDAGGIITVPKTYRARPVVGIGENAFFNCADVKEVILPDSIKQIGAYAFANCAYLEKINLPASLTSLGEGAFSGCRMLSGELDLPDGLTEIPKSAFAYCSGIESVSFGEGVRSIGESAFTDASGIKELSFPTTLRKIGPFAFAACTGITEINLPEGLSTVGEFAFSKVISLTEISLPDSLESLGKGAFYYCSSLSDISFGKGISEVGDSAFLETKVYNDCQTNEIYICNWFVGLRDTSVSSVTIKDGTVGIANGAMYANQTVAAIELPDSVKYVGKNAFAVSNLVSVVIGSGVVRVDDQAFLYCERLIDAILGSFDYGKGRIAESSLEYIGSYAFMNCTKLAKIEIPDTVKDIGSYAFRNTDMYNSATLGAVYAGNWLVDFNDKITEELAVEKGTVGIARYALYNCTALRTVKIDNSVKVICRGAFYNCTALERLTLPDTLVRIEDYTFYGCSSLLNITLPPMLQYIGRSAFYMCGTLAANPADTDSDTLNIPAGVTYIGDYAFFGCGYRAADSIDGVTESCGIDSVIMGERIEYLGKSAFRGFSSLKRVTIGGAQVIGEGAFYGCLSLEEVSVSAALREVGARAFYKCGALRRLTLPDTLVSIGDYAFYKCESLTEAELGHGLVSIGKGAFWGNTALGSVVLPSGLESVGESAFRNCTSLTYLAVGESVGHVGAHAFYACPSLTIYLDADADTSGWSGEWNSSYIAVVLGCDISDGILLSVTGTDGGILNCFSDTVISPPTMASCSFLGWKSDPASTSAQLAPEYISEIAPGNKIYPVFGAADNGEGSDI